MKHIIFIALLFCTFSARAQYPTHPTKQELGRQTTGDGLTFRGSGAPAYTPTGKNNAWMFLDTLSGTLYAYRGGSWQLVNAGGVTDVSISNDTLYITTADSTFFAVFDDANTNFANTNLTFTGNRVHNLSTRTLTIADGGTYPTFQQSAATDGFTIASSATDLIAQTPGLLQIENSDTITITADRIRMNAADTRIQQVAKDNALNRLVALDSLTGQLKYVDKSSISSGGTVTGTGTTGTIPVWSSSTALGDSPLTVSSGSVIAGGTGFFRFPVGTTAQRPGTPQPGDARYNSTLGNLDFYGASAWENPVRSANGTGLGTADYVSFYDANGRLSGGNAGLRVINSTSFPTVQFGQNATLNNNTRYFWIDGNEFSRTLTNSFGSTRTAATGALNFSIIASGAHPYNIFSGVYSQTLTSATLAAGSNITSGIYVASQQSANKATRITGLYAQGENYGTGGSGIVDGVYARVVNAAGTVDNVYALRAEISNTATITNTFGVWVGDITSGTQTNTPRSFYATDGNAINVFHGRTRINSTSGPSEALHVTGKIQADTLTDTAASIAGFTGTSGAGVLTRLALGSGLSITSGTLSATGGTGTTNLAFSGASSPVTLTSDTGTDVIFAAGSGLALSQSGGTATYSRTYSLIHTTITGGSTFFGTTAERPDNDTPGSATTSAVGSDFSVSGSTIDYTGGSGALIRVQGSISFSVADDGDYYVSMYKEGTEIAATSMRVSCVAGNYYSISLPATTTTGSTNDTFDLRIATVSGNSTTTMHRYGFILERIY